MGIKNLTKFLRKQCPEIFVTIPLSNYEYKKIAIDVYLYIFKFKCIFSPENTNPNNWLNIFMELIYCLRRNNIHGVFIYDTCANVEKKDEQKKRKEAKEKTELKIDEYESLVEKYHLTNEIDPILRELHNKLSGENIHKKLLATYETKFNIYIVENYILKKKSQVVHLTKDDIELSKKLFETLKIPYYNAPMEAEPTCVELCKNGLVDAVLSDDSDILAYSSPIFLTKIDMRKDTCIEIDYKLLLEKLEFTTEQFLDLCILCGTDYNKNLPKIGPVNAYRLLKQYGSIDEISKNKNLDISILNYDKVKNIFTNYTKFDIKKIKYCGIPDLEKLKLFCKNLDIHFSESRYNKIFFNNTLNFEL